MGIISGLGSHHFGPTGEMFANWAGMLGEKTVVGGVAAVARGWLARRRTEAMQPPTAGSPSQRGLGWLLLFAPLAACSATSAVQHSPAQFTPIDQTRTVEADADMVLRRLISRLPAAGLTVVEIAEAARTVRVSLTTDQPGAYVDCGRTRRTFEGVWGSLETFDYEPATSASYKLTSYDGDALEATRDVVLDAAVTVRMQPGATTTEAAATEVRVEVSYDLETQVTYNEVGALVFASDDAEPVTRAIRFQTDRPGIGDGEVALCMSNGKLEARILGLAT